MQETSRHILVLLVIVNGVILIVSGCLGYILAGQTLRPIQLMLDEQHRFISDSSHELRTPLTALKSTMEVNLRDKHLTVSGARGVLRDSIEEVNKLQALSDALLQLAQFQKQNNHTANEKISLPGLIADSVKKVMPIAQNKAIEITSDVPELVIKGDKIGLSELFVILLDNAIKYSSPNGKIEVTAKASNSAVAVRIKDHGMGISEKDIPHIFDRFYRADAARTKNSASGYGLGLSIAKKICDIHNGTITAESDKGTGTVFTVRLPATFS
jgi:signal transduction histidine kinase